MKNKISNIILSIIFITGLGILAYPTVSDFYNAMNQSRAVSNYTQQVANMDKKESIEMLKAAKKYNKKLATRPVTSFVLSKDELVEYNSLINATEIMSYIEIPAIHCTLPVYHGVEEEVLNVGVGHIAGSSLPVGGKSTHCVLSGHRGLPSAKLFTDLDKVVEGDFFLLQTLQETLTYKVDQIRIVEPDELSNLEIVQGKDYCTLVTCTPYGVNTHRLLVRGERVDNMKDDLLVTAGATQIKPMIVAPYAAIPIFLIMLVWVFSVPVKKERR